MEVIQVYHHDPCDRGKGGAVRYLSNLLKYLPQRGIFTTLYGVEINECPQNLNFKHEPILKNSNLFWVYLIKLFIKLPFLRIDSKSIIHVHRIEYVIPFIFFKRNNRLVLTLHGERLATGREIYSKFVFFFISKIYRIVEYLSLKRSHHIVAVSDEVKDSFLNFNKNSLLKFSVIPVGVDLNLFRPLNKNFSRKKWKIGVKTKVILFVGVLGKIKNLNFLINSFSRFIVEYPDSLLIIVGDGPEKHFLEKNVSELSINSKIKFMGEIENEELPEIYNLADIFAFTSISEGSPTVIREALACGVPIVSTDVGDVKDVIKNSKAGLISEYDVKSFSGALIKLESQIRNDGSLKEKCIESVKPYSFEIVAEEYIQIYRKLRV